MKELKMIRAKGDGVEIQVADWPGQGQTILAVHGMTANSRCFDVMAPALSPKHRFLAVDLRGRGLSDKPPTGYSLDQHVRDIEAVLADLGLKKVFMMGHSLGAYVSLVFTAKRPDLVEGLILIDGGAVLPPEQWVKISAAIKPSTDRLSLTFPSFEAYVEHVKQTPYLHPWTEAMENYFRYESEEVGGRVRSRVRPETVQQESAGLVTVDPTQFYPQVKCPVLVLRATEGMLTDDDLILPKEAAGNLKKALPQAEIVELAGANHYSLVLQPNPVRDRAILDLLGA